MFGFSLYLCLNLLFLYLHLYLAVFVFSLKGTGLCGKGNEGMPGSDFRMGGQKVA